MQDKTLLKISVICSLVGIIVLFLIADNLNLSTTEISKIQQSELGKQVKITGKIESLSETDTLMFLTVGQEKIETVSVVLFKDSDIALEKGDNIELTGTLEDYEGKREILANRIVII